MKAAAEQRGGHRELLWPLLRAVVRLLSSALKVDKAAFARSLVVLLHRFLLVLRFSPCLYLLLFTQLIVAEDGLAGFRTAVENAGAAFHGWKWPRAAGLARAAPAAPAGAPPPPPLPAAGAGSPAPPAAALPHPSLHSENFKHMVADCARVGLLWAATVLTAAYSGGAVAAVVAAAPDPWQAVLEVLSALGLAAHSQKAFSGVASLLCAGAAFLPGYGLAVSSACTATAHGVSAFSAAAVPAVVVWAVNSLLGVVAAFLALHAATVGLQARALLVGEALALGAVYLHARTADFVFSADPATRGGAPRAGGAMRARDVLFALLWMLVEFAALFAGCWAAFAFFAGELMRSPLGLAYAVFHLRANLLGGVKREKEKAAADDLREVKRAVTEVREALKALAAAAPAAPAAPAEAAAAAAPPPAPAAAGAEAAAGPAEPWKGTFLVFAWHVMERVWAAFWSWLRSTYEPIKLTEKMKAEQAAFLILVAAVFALQAAAWLFDPDGADSD
jgi:hypothetical protein